MNLTGKSSCLFTIRGKRQRAVQQSSVLTRTSKPKTRRVKGQSRSLSQPKKNTGIKCQEETGVAPMGCKAIFTHVQPKFNQCKNVFLTLFHFLNLLNFLFLVLQFHLLVKNVFFLNLLWQQLGIISIYGFCFFVFLRKRATVVCIVYKYNIISFSVCIVNNTFLYEMCLRCANSL